VLHDSFADDLKYVRVMLGSHCRHSMALYSVAPVPVCGVCKSVHNWRHKNYVPQRFANYSAWHSVPALNENTTVIFAQRHKATRLVQTFTAMELRSRSWTKSKFHKRNNNKLLGFQLKSNQIKTGNETGTGTVNRN